MKDSSKVARASDAETLCPKDRRVSDIGAVPVFGMPLDPAVRAQSLVDALPAMSRDDAMAFSQGSSL